jgi:hypothetical protein
MLRHVNLAISERPQEANEVFAFLFSAYWRKKVIKSRCEGNLISNFSEQIFPTPPLTVVVVLQSTFLRTKRRLSAG